MDDAINDQQSDAADAEFDSWLREVNEGICDSLDDVVDTETDLLRVKQTVAQRAMAVAHASGSDGADRAIRQVFEDDPQASSGFEGGVRRAAPGPGPRAPRYFKRWRRDRSAGSWAAAARVIATVAAVAVVAVLMGTAVFFTPSSVVAAVTAVATSVVLLWRLRRPAALRRKAWNKHLRLRVTNPSDDHCPPGSL